MGNRLSTVGLAATWSSSIKVYGTMSSEPPIPKNSSKPTALGPSAIGRAKSTFQPDVPARDAGPDGVGERRGPRPPRPAHAEVPLADGGGVVSGPSEERRHGQ